MALLLFQVRFLHTQKEETSFSGTLLIPLLTCRYFFCFYSDDGVCFPIQKGLAASRSKLKFFRHNDMDHLQQLLEEQRALDLKVHCKCLFDINNFILYIDQNPAKAKVTRKFLVAEGIYYNSGDLAPLPRLVS